MKTGDYIVQPNTETTALVMNQLKNGSFRALAHDYRGRIVQTTITNWYPAPVVVPVETISPKIIAKINSYRTRTGL